MRILHVVGSLGRDSGGLGVSVSTLARGTAEEGHVVVVATLMRGPDDLSVTAREAVAEGGVKLAGFRPFPPRAVGFSWELPCGLRRLTRWADVVHVHSAWTFPVWWACRSALLRHKPLVVSPRGVLDPVRLRHSAWKKRLAGCCFDRRYLRRATLLHATSQAEKEWIAAYLRAGNGHVCRNGPAVAVVPDSLEIPGAAPSGAALVPEAETTRRGGGGRMALFLGRLHPLKGVDLLLEAWQRTGRARPADAAFWRLLIVGPDEQGTRAALLRQAGRLGLACRCIAGGRAGEAGDWIFREPRSRRSAPAEIIFAGPVDGDAKWDLYRQADLVVLPSRSENFGIVVAEAAGMGKPVVATQATPWSGLAERRAGWWTPVSVEGLAGALDEALAMPAAGLAAMGARGREWVATEFGRSRIARQWVEIYSWLLGRGLMPPCVQLLA